MEAIFRGQVGPRFSQPLHAYSCVALAQTQYYHQHQQKRSLFRKVYMTPEVRHLLKDDNSALLKRFTAKGNVRVDFTGRSARVRGNSLLTNIVADILELLNGDKFRATPASPIDVAAFYTWLDQMPPQESVKVEFANIYKSVMRNVPSCPVVLSSGATAKLPVSERAPVEDNSLYGLTVSSMTSVSLYPNPVLSFSIKRPSRTLDAIQAAGSIVVHLLQDNHAGAQIAHTFAQPHDHPATPFRQLVARNLIEIHETRFKDAEMHGPGVAARFNCKLLDTTVDIADHTVIFAKVERSTTDPVDSPFLAYVRGTYKEMAHTNIDPILPPQPEGASEDPIAVMRDGAVEGNTSAIQLSQRWGKVLEWMEDPKPKHVDPGSLSPEHAAAWGETTLERQSAKDSVSETKSIEGDVSSQTAQGDDDSGLSTYWEGSSKVHDKDTSVSVESSKPLNTPETPKVPKAPEPSSPPQKDNGRPRWK